jgi:hypothetical protein
MKLVVSAIALSFSPFCRLQLCKRSGAALVSVRGVGESDESVSRFKAC